MLLYDGWYYDVRMLECQPKWVRGQIACDVNHIIIKKIKWIRHSLTIHDTWIWGPSQYFTSLWIYLYYIYIYCFLIAIIEEEMLISSKSQREIGHRRYSFIWSTFISSFFFFFFGGVMLCCISTVSIWTNYHGFKLH